jgi:hypothetical protein
MYSGRIKSPQILSKLGRRPHPKRRGKWLTRPTKDSAFSSKRSGKCRTMVPTPSHWCTVAQELVAQALWSRATLSLRLWRDLEKIIWPKSAGLSQTLTTLKLRFKITMNR